VTGRAILSFLKTDAAGGIILAVCAALALVLANSGAGPLYQTLIHYPLPLDFGPLSIHLTTEEWVKDGLMTLFFFVVGLELKREVVEGELSEGGAVVLPVAAALGGMIGPALVYLAMAHDADLRGWPVPVATDIAFAVAALAIFAPKAPSALRIFLLTLAVVDDLGAVVLIAVLFSTHLALPLLVFIAGALFALACAGRIARLPAWIWALGALFIWGLALKSGIHTSVAGVAAAFTVPLSGGRLAWLETRLHPLSAYVVLPLFALVATGIPLTGLSLHAAFAAVPFAIAAALVLGKPLGVLGGTYLVARLRLARLPSGAGFAHLAGIACLCGIGFTMSLFLAALAFRGDGEAERAARLGILAGSLLALALGAGIFAFFGRGAAKDPPTQ
jgi:NhaA family Na+:H+ antiporter